MEFGMYFRFKKYVERNFLTLHKNISKDYQEMSQSRSTAFLRHQKKVIQYLTRWYFSKFASKSKIYTISVYKFIKKIYKQNKMIITKKNIDGKLLVQQ